jgi:hypothetical protein
MSSFEGELTSYLQDVSEEAGGLLGDIMQNDVEIVDGNYDQAKKLLNVLKEAADMIIDLRKWRAEASYDNSEEAIRRELSPVYL